MLGYLVLCGGDAYSPNSRNMDYAWLQIIRRHYRRPRVVVVPVAEVKNPGKMAQIATSYYKDLGTFAEYTMITDQLTANTRVNYEILDKVEAICFTDGSPFDMVEQLVGTHTEEALHRTLLERKAAIMGAGASAMALGAVYWLGGTWEKGLGVAPHLAILPHYEHVQGRYLPERLMVDLPQGVTILGVDEATAVICHPDGTYEVTGNGVVTVYRSVEQQDEYENGATFTLETSASPE
jgi:cyanophycinase-like exopeptidase